MKSFILCRGRREPGCKKERILSIDNEVSQKEKNKYIYRASRLPAQRSIVDARTALRPCTQTGTSFPGNWRFSSATGRIFHACHCISETFSDLPSSSRTSWEKTPNQGQIMAIYFWKGLQPCPNPFISRLKP